MCSQKLRIVAICAMFASCFLFSSVCGAATITSEQQKTEKTITVSINKLNTLKSLLDAQEQKINLLEKQFQQPKTELMKQQQSISRLQSSLTTAQNSLAKSELIIEEQNSSLVKLSEAIKQSSSRERRIKLQRTFWELTAGCLTIALIKNH